MRQGLARIALAGMLVAALPAAADEKVYKYQDEDGVTVLTNVAPGTAKKSLRMKDEGELTKVTAPLEFVPSKDTQEFDAHIQEACALYKIPPALVRAIMAAESNFNPLAVSPKGAQGLMQLMPETAAEMFVADVFDPRQNVMGGVRYLRVLANMFNGDMVQIVAGYNAGPAAVKQAGGIPAVAETQEYVKRVLRLYFAYKNENKDPS